MTDSQLDPSGASPAELEARSEAERAGAPFLLYRDDRGRQRIHRFDPDARVVTVGRAASADISFPWDDKVSRLHARLELVGDDLAADWTVVDDGPSRNGTFVNGKRVRGRSRLADGDTVYLGDTPMVFRAPLPEGSPQPDAEQPRTEPRPAAYEHETTVFSRRQVTLASLSDSQRRVLAALARPGPKQPATDEQIAAELFLGIDTVREQLHAMAILFGVEELPPQEQRAQLVERGLRSGLLPGGAPPR